MVVDTSALFAILVGEDERDQFEDLILRSPTAVISVVSIVETVIALTRKQLNICFPYALAKARGDTLLFKGEDFSKTDLIPAWQP
jgi:uncharacterized protein with PIN domain